MKFLVILFALLLSLCPSLLNAIVGHSNSEVFGGCNCVAKYMCLDNNIEYTNREFGIRCQNPLEVCCKIHSIRNLKNNGFVICGYPALPRMDSRITTTFSEASEFGELPWSIIVLLQKNGELFYVCGGSLIHRQVVLTAAHCVFASVDGKWFIRAGEWNVKNNDEPLPHQDRTVQEIVVHPRYKSGSQRNDIALLFLAKPLKRAENVRIICLPSTKTQLNEGAACIASGWGKDKFKKGQHPAILKKVEVSIVSRKPCLKSLRNTRLGQFFHLHRSFICAGGERNKDACTGDGGGPLICPVPGSEGRFQQVGIVSWGIGCGEENVPGIYVNLQLYVNWIDKEMYLRNYNIHY